MWEQLEDVEDFTLSNPKTLVFYFPIEFPVVDDGFRSKDEEFRKKIDENIKNILNYRHIPYIEVRGTVEERLNTIKQHFPLI